MKNLYTIILFLTACFFANGQGTWTQKANFGDTAIQGAVGFSIGTKGYIGTGNTCGYGCAVKDFWEWDQATNSWTQKASFGGTARSGAVGFSIGAKGYIGTGWNGSNSYNDFWEWDQASNTWFQKANFPGTARYGATGFAIGSKGYLGTGMDNTIGITQDFWEWDQASNTWTLKANYGGGPGYGAIGFSIGTKGYIGVDSLNNNFWEWDQASNIWTQKANFAGTIRKYAVGFSIGTKGYVGTGGDFSNITGKEFWEWDQATNTWTQKANVGGTIREGAIGFSIGTKGYIATGWDNSSWAARVDFWEFYDLNISVAMVGTPICINQCSGTANASVSGGTPPYTYLWNTTPTQTTSVATGLCAGTNTITVADALGSVANTVTITTIPPPVAPSICMVTTDSATSFLYNVVVWDKTIYNNVDSFILYRKDAISSNYLRIGAVSKNALSEFVDTVFSIGGPNGGNPLYSSWLYKMAIRDSCGAIGAQGPYHQSMFVQKSGSNFSWNAYAIETGQINPLTGYSFLRDDNNNGNWHVLVNTIGLSTTDPNYASYPNANWRIDALGFNCTPTMKLENIESTYIKSHSNTTKPTVAGINELSLNERIIIYPNPTSGTFQITSDNLRIMNAEIYNVMGEKVYASIITNQSSIINLDAPNGIYFLQLKTEQGMATKKLVISK